MGRKDYGNDWKRR
jgi:hypothetical protein